MLGKPVNEFGFEKEGGSLGLKSFPSLLRTVGGVSIVVSIMFDGPVLVSSSLLSSSLMSSSSSSDLLLFG